MTLDQLRYFEAVCKYGSVTEAAKTLNISQPSVSNALIKLENEFGSLLFTRENKKMLLTKEGTILLDLAKELISNADNLVKTMSSLSETKELNLGVPPMFSSLILPIIYKNFLARHPDFKVNIVEDDRKGLMKKLDDNRINMAFLPHSTPFEDKYKAKELTSLNNLCCVSKEHPLAKNKTVSVDDLKDEPLILFKNSFFQTERLLERFKQKGITPNLLLDTAQVSTVENLAASGLAVGFVFDFLLKSTPDLVGIPLDPPLQAKVSLVWKQSENLTSDMNRFIKFIEEFSLTL